MVCLTLLAFAAWAALAARADAFVYWANGGSTTIGRADLDGTNVNQSFISGANFPRAMAVDGAHVYWTNFGAIGRADLDGTNVNQSFITGVSAPRAMAVDGAHVYWTNFGNGAIGRANLDGTNVNQNFITGVISFGVAVDGAHIYWTNGLISPFTTIGRADLDGTNVNQNFITNASAPIGVAVDGAHVYWTNNGTSTIGRADLGGTNVNQSFISVSGGPQLAAVAVDGAHVYWTDFDLNGTIGRADLGGTNVNQSFITGASEPFGVAVDGLPAPTPITPAQSPSAGGPNCKKLRTKLKRQQNGLAEAGSEAKRAMIQANIKDTKKRLKKRGCKPASK